MSSEFDAIYERGIFRPLGPVDLPEHTKVHLQMERNDVSVSASPPASEVAVQQAAMLKLLQWLNEQPAVNTPENEPISARDHDQILYGWRQ